MGLLSEIRGLIGAARRGRPSTHETVALSRAASPFTDTDRASRISVIRRAFSIAMTSRVADAMERVPRQCISDYGNKRPMGANQGYAGAE